jgi:hypothetical protein
MEQNVKVAKDLLKLAKMLVAAGADGDADV